MPINNMTIMLRIRFSQVLSAACVWIVRSALLCDGFVGPERMALLARSSTLWSVKPPQHHHQRGREQAMQAPSRVMALFMGMDMVTYLRTEWVAAALCTNQTPRAADVCLQLGTDDGRAVTFIPRTIRELITSSAEKDGKLTVSARRQLKQQRDRRQAATVTYVDQRADDLKETADESVDVVISLMAAQRMVENGLDWKRSVREAARILKPGGRLLFVEQTELNGESYLEYVQNLVSIRDDEPGGDDNGAEPTETFPIFDNVGFDEVDMTLVSHTAGVAVKSVDTGLSEHERARKEAAKDDERLAGLSIEAFERGRKKRKRKKSNAEEQEKAESKANK